MAATPPPIYFTSSPELMTAIATSVVAQQLESLSLVAVALDDQDALALAAGQFPRLRRLDVSRNQMSSRGIAAVEALCAEVETWTEPISDAGCSR